jgi:hypothetical protein
MNTNERFAKAPILSNPLLALALMLSMSASACCKDNGTEQSIQDLKNGECAKESAKASDTRTSKQAIIGGRLDTMNVRTAVGRLLRDDQWVCSAVSITDGYIITASSCAYDIGSRYRFDVDIYGRDIHQFSDLQTVGLYARFERSVGDFALLALESSDPRIEPMPLASNYSPSSCICPMDMLHITGTGEAVHGAGYRASTASPVIGAEDGGGRMLLETWAVTTGDVGGPVFTHQGSEPYVVGIMLSHSVAGHALAARITTETYNALVGRLHLGQQFRAHDAREFLPAQDECTFRQPGRLGTIIEQPEDDDWWPHQDL